MKRGQTLLVLCRHDEYPELKLSVLSRAEQRPPHHVLFCHLRVLDQKCEELRSEMASGGGLLGQDLNELMTATPRAALNR